MRPMAHRTVLELCIRKVRATVAVTAADDVGGVVLGSGAGPGVLLLRIIMMMMMCVELLEGWSMLVTFMLKC